MSSTHFACESLRSDPRLSDFPRKNAMALLLLIEGGMGVLQKRDMINAPPCFARAFTLLDLLIVIAACALIVAALLPVFARSHGCSCRLNCVNNLKQIGLSFRTFALDNNDLYPAQVPIAQGGSQELALSGTADVHFRVMSNELSTPKILMCPADPDKRRIAATTFTFPSPPPQVPFNSDLHLSYFASIDAQEQYPSIWLAGDRQIGIDGRQPQPGLLAVLTNSRVQWVKPPHNNRGNIAFADGSVRQMDSRELRGSLAKSELNTNRLAMP